MVNTYTSTTTVVDAAITTIDREDAGRKVGFLPLEKYRIAGMPEVGYYIRDFVTPAESDALITAINKQPWTTLTHRRLQPHPAPLTPAGHLLTTKALPSFLKPVIERLLELSFSDTGTLAAGNIDTVNTRYDRYRDQDVKNACRGIFTDSPHRTPNHVLINEYPPGTGISPHEDGGAYFPVVCTISLGSHTVLEVTPKQTSPDISAADSHGAEKRYRILQEPLSLLISMGDVYTSHLHGIAAVTTDENLTSDSITNWQLLAEETRREIERQGGAMARSEVRVSLTCRDVIKVRDAGWVFGGKRR
ncbi:hypothetical protein ABW21_db0202596 [Orbilia brochopaga]|nr:hypothetical protein ABW21_db0202596 [Drechslerella brochopaga]